MLALWCQIWPQNQFPVDCLWLERYKKAVLSQRRPRDAPNVWVSWKLYASAIKQPTIAQDLHITILSLFGGEIIFEVFHPMGSRHLRTWKLQSSRSKRYTRTDRQTNVTVASSCYAKHRAVKTISPMLRSKSAWALSYLAVKLFSKNSSLCDHDNYWHLNVTDGQTTCNLITAPCVASRGSLPDSHCLRYKQQRPFKMLQLYSSTTAMYQ